MENNITIGMDLGDQNHVVIVLYEKGKEIEMKTIRNREWGCPKSESNHNY